MDTNTASNIYSMLEQTCTPSCVLTDVSNNTELSMSSSTIDYIDSGECFVGQQDTMKTNI